MPICAEIEGLLAEVESIKQVIISRIDARLDNTGDAQDAFAAWITAFESGSTDRAELFQKLVPHVQWPV